MKLTKEKIFASLMTLALLAILIVPTFALAEDDDPSGGTCEACTCPTGYDCILDNGFPACSTGDAGDAYRSCLPQNNFVNADMELLDTVTMLINILMSLLGFIAVIIVLIGGFKWMTAAGEDSKVAEAKKTLSAGVIGLVIIMAAWGIARFVINILAKA
jgi:hypothetical protein